MIRHRIIRFFISSTFADMTMERNTLYNIFTELKPYCKQKGWLLENVDLRWGISREAGLDNRTMTICLDELKRCQKLSPHPNFIILLGERYGWIPLPETIPYTHKSLIDIFANQKEKELFEQWYRLDMNALPNGEYILKEREGGYRDYDVYEKEVESPLRNLFCYIAEFMEYDEDRIKFGASATEQEIYYGALSVEDAHKHVLVYRRQLQNIPKELQNIYLTPEDEVFPFFSERTKLDLLCEKVERKIPQERLCKKSIDFSYYISEEFQKEYYDQMYNHIKQLIDDEINQNNENDLELEIKSHWEFAQQEIQSFIGRERELEQIEAFIRNPESSYLWIQAESGMGKSSLISKAVIKFKDEFNIICRFCDTTNVSGTATGLLSSIVDELINLYPAKKWHNPFTYTSEAIMERPIFEELQCIFTNITTTKPLLIVLDAVNQLNDSAGIGFKYYNWLPYPKHTKIIISSTEEPKTLSEGRNWEVIRLSGMKDNPFKLITRIFELGKRTLTETQVHTALHFVEQSDCSPLYLFLLSNYLLRIPSWESINFIPTDTKDLINSIITNLSMRQYHDEYLIKLSLSLFAYDRLGLSEGELIDILSSDNDLYHSLMNKSFHSWNPLETNRIPAVIWSRLFYDISYFLRIHQTRVGELIHIYHKLVEEVISDLFLGDFYFKQKVGLLLNNYYKVHWENGDYHSISEYPRTLYSLANHKAELRQLLAELLENINFISTKAGLFKYAIKEDYDLLISLNNNPEKVEHLLKLKNEIISISSGSREQFCALALNLPHGSLLRNISQQQISERERNKVLKNELSDFVQSEEVCFYLKPGTYKGISSDGKRVVCIGDNPKNVEIINLLNPHKSHSYTMPDKILLLETDDTLQYHAVLTEKFAILYDSINNEILYSKENQGIYWTTISTDGKKCAFGGPEGYKLYENNLVWKKEGEYINGRLSHSGKYLWLIVGNKLQRMKLADKSYLNYPLQHQLSYCNEFCGNDTYISDCSDEWCILIHKCNVVIVGTYYKANGETFFWLGCVNSTWEKRVCVAISRDASTMILSNETGFTCIAKLPISNDEIANLKLDWCVAKDMRSVDLITPDFSYALSTEDKIIFSLNQSINNIKPREGGNCGINSFTGSASGDLLLSSIGINKVIDSEQDVLLFRISEDKIERTILHPEFNNEYIYVASSKVAPDKSFFVLTSFPINEQKSEILFYDNQYKVNHHKAMGTMEFTAIAISTDSKYVAVCSGAYLSGCTPVILIYSANCIQLDHYFIKEDNMIGVSVSDDIRFTQNNRYIILCDYTLYVIDMKEHVFLEDHIECSSAPKPLVSLAYRKFLLAILPDDRTIITSANHNIYIQQLPSGEITCIPSEATIMGCSPSGRYLYYVSGEKNSLFQLNILTKERFLILDNVCYIIPTFNDEYIYALQYNNEIHLVNTVACEIRQSYYLHKIAYHFSHTAKGLAVAQNNGDFLLLSPLKQYSVNVPACITVVKHWNYGLHVFDAPKATCPLCGYSFEPSDNIIDTIKKYKGDILPCMSIPQKAWEEQNLLNHHCPNCRGLLRFNPFMT